MIISVSRRCDIPRFQFDWFLERMDAGFVDVPNPFNAAQLRRVSLLPAGSGGKDANDAEALVFWTRDPGSILAHAEEIEGRGFPFYVMVTVTGYPAVLEPNVPQADAVCAAMCGLAHKIGCRRLVWRYDPVFLSSLTDADFHRRNFGELARRLQGAVQRVIISLYDEYRGAKRRIAALENAGALRLLPQQMPQYLPLFADEQVQPDAANKPGAKVLLPDFGGLLADMAETAAAFGMEIQSCAEAENLAPFGIKPGACIDGGLLQELWSLETKGKDKNQRPHCLCCQSVDIGQYGSCPAGCVYCYAQR